MVPRENDRLFFMFTFSCRVNGKVRGDTTGQAAEKVFEEEKGILEQSRERKRVSETLTQCIMGASESASVQPYCVSVLLYNRCAGVVSTGSDPRLVFHCYRNPLS